MKKLSSFKTVLHGCCMGISEVIPGVSGGTMAVLLNIYDKFIGSISNIRHDFKKSISFLIPLLIGMVLGILGFSFIITYLNARFPMEINSLFLGLVIGLFPMLFKRSVKGGFRLLNFIPFIVLFIAMVCLSYFSLSSESTTTIITTHTLSSALKFLAVGCLAAVCMILPGVSGSMIMLIFGIYFSVLEAIKSLNILILIPLGIGVIVGILFGAKLVDNCLKKSPNATYFGILGLVLGSTLTIYCNNLVYGIKYMLDIVVTKNSYSYSFDNFKMLLIHGILSMSILCLGFFVSYIFTRHEE